VYDTLANVLRAPELRGRILFTLAMLAIFRLGIFIPAPGVDRTALAEYFQSNQGTLLGLYDMFSGGALLQFSVFVLGIMPYISASIIMQVLGVVLPQVERLRNEGQQGRNRINQYTRYGTLLLAVFQSLGIALALDGRAALISGSSLAGTGGLLTWVNSAGMATSPPEYSTGMVTPVGLHRARTMDIWTIADEAANETGQIFVFTTPR